MKIGVLVLGQPAETAPVPVDREQVAQSAIISGEDELLAIRAPRWGGDTAQLRLNPLDLLVPLYIDNDDVVPRPTLSCKREVLAVGRPVGLGVDEPVGLVIAADPGLEDPALHLAGDAIGQIKINEIEVLLAEVGDLGTVGREGGCEVERPLGALLGQQ